jgi:hypothetical protein
VHTPTKPYSAEPATLQEARERLRTLQRHLASPSQPSASLPIRPSADPGSPATNPVPVIDPTLPPLKLRQALASLTNQELKMLLAKETGRSRRDYNSRLVAELYFEAKDRKL